MRIAALSFALTAILVAPYLISCARAFGDPLYALNYHTGFYRAREHTEAAASMSAAGYVLGKLRTRPARLADTVLYGLTIFPFTNKWDGLAAWSTVLARVSPWAAAAGLAVFAFSWQGRLLLGVLVLSVLPFAVTWNIPGGGEWRFTLAAYPFYLTAAGVMVVQIIRWVRGLVRAPGGTGPMIRRIDRRTLVVVAVGAALILSGLHGLPWLALREGVAREAHVTIVPDSRDDVVFWSGWEPRTAGRCLAAAAATAQVRLPLPADGTFRLTTHLVGTQPAGTGDNRISLVVDGRNATSVTLRLSDRHQAASVTVAPAARRLALTTLELRSARASSGPTRGAASPLFAICSVEIARVTGDGHSD
jgi:hypothetical protein